MVIIYEVTNCGISFTDGDTGVTPTAYGSFLVHNNTIRTTNKIAKTSPWQQHPQYKSH